MACLGYIRSHGHALTLVREPVDAVLELTSSEHVLSTVPSFKE
jgi:hypothetical protein